MIFVTHLFVVESEFFVFFLVSNIFVVWTVIVNIIFLVNIGYSDVIIYEQNENTQEDQTNFESSKQLVSELFQRLNMKIFIDGIWRFWWLSVYF